MSMLVEKGSTQKESLILERFNDAFHFTLLLHKRLNFKGGEVGIGWLSNGHWGGSVL